MHFLNFREKSEDIFCLPKLYQIMYNDKIKNYFYVFINF